MVISHTVKGQNWKGALSAIQRKSVGYVLADKQTLQTVYAVELDDWSHDRDDRVERDSSVEAMLHAAGVTLIRFRDVDNLSDEALAQHFYEAAHSVDHHSDYR